MKITTKIVETKKSLAYVVRVTPPRASRAMSCLEDMDAYMAKDTIEQMIPAYDAGEMVVGEVYMILSLTTERGVETLRIADDNGEGWGGNLDYTNKKYRGWRGTSNGTSAYAMGLRQLISCEISGKRSKKLKVVFGPNISERSES
jgi:hypothetical protein